MPRHPDDMLPEHFEYGSGCTREEDEENCGCGEEDDCECSSCRCEECDPHEPDGEEWDPEFDDSFMYDCERY